VGLKKILMLAGIGIACFMVSLILGWKVSTPATAAAGEPNQASHETPEKGFINPMAEGFGSEPKVNLTSLSEKQLESMIFELREKMKETSKREKDLQVQEERLRTASEEIKGDLDKLNSLRTELAATVAQIKQDREAMGKDAVTITAAETVKLQQIASIHDKMDPVSGATLLLSMVTNKRVDDAVQILNYMQERNAAKVLSEMVTKDPKVATLLCERLKKVKEEKKS
jgi:flagellar motility protein MotE (MotC chaperone)